MANNIKLVVYPVGDVAKAKTFFSQFLETQPYVDSPFYIGYKVGDLEVGLDPNSKLGPIAYTDVKDIRASLKAMTGAGAVIVEDVRDVAQGLLVAKIKDPAGNVVGLRQQS